MGLQCRIVVIRHILCGLWQSAQTPVAAHGVSIPRLFARMCAATSWTLFKAESRSDVQLVHPGHHHHLFGAERHGGSRFPMPSTLTISPVTAMAFALQKNMSQRPWPGESPGLAPGRGWAAMVVDRLFRPAQGRCGFPGSGPCPNRRNPNVSNPSASFAIKSRASSRFSAKRVSKPFLFKFFMQDSALFLPSHFS